MAGPGKRQSVYFVLVTIFIDAMGYGLAGPVLPRLIMDIGKVDVSAAISFGGWMTLSYAAVQFLMGPVIGNLSDRFGRRPVLLLALSGLVLNYFLLSVAGSLSLLFVGQMLGGMFGGTLGTCQAAIADMTRKEDRAHNFSLVGAAFGLGFIVGPAIGGLLGDYGERVPFYTAAALTFCSLLYGWFVFPDTLRPEDRRAFDWKRANPLGAAKSMLAMPGMTSAVLVIMLWYIATAVYPLTWPYYGIARFNWSNGMIGASLAAVGCVTALSQAFLTRRVVARHGERRTALFGMTGGLLTFLGYAFITESWMAFAIMIGFVAQSMVAPSMMAILTNRASADAQGEVQGVAAMAQGVGGMVAPLLINPTMAYFTSPEAPVRFAGAGFVVAAIFALAALVRLATLPRMAPLRTVTA
ncbi:MAG: MFS transporter [Sphingobium sp.]|nr:MFS transporter [Sphingobium sp.]